jgi:DNA polymerase-3 subunit delta
MCADLNTGGNMAAKNSGLTELRKHIKDKTIGGLYFFFGDEEYLKDDYIRRLRVSLPPDPMRDFNYTKFEGAEHTPDELDGAIEEYPVMAEKRVVELVNTGFFKKCTPEMSDYLKKRFADLPEHTLLIIREKEIDKRSAAYKAAVKYGLAVECAYLSDGDLVDWICRYVMDARKQIRREDAQYLITLCDDGLHYVQNELDKLISYSGEVITQAEMDRVVSKSVNVRVFEMTDGIMERNADKALSILEDLKTMKEPAFRILYLLFSTFDKMLYAKILADEGAPYAEIAKRLGVPPFIAQKYVRGANGFSKEFLINRVCAVCELDLAIKQGTVDEWSALEGFVTVSFNA